ncbi:MAG: DUF1292 domain-containing protein [Erysipelotrichaceae bacterium]|nr:DUF1292 domain-containing protein [Erysipelotrichaceae bacterium]
MDENQIYITDDTGVEHAFKILLTYENDGSQYVLVEDPNDSDQAYLFRVGEDHTIEIVEDEEQLEIAEEIFSTAFGDEE